MVDFIMTNILTHYKFITVKNYCNKMFTRRGTIIKVCNKRQTKITRRYGNVNIPSVDCFIDLLDNGQAISEVVFTFMTGK